MPKITILLCLFLTGSTTFLSAQNFRLLADGGGLFPSESHNKIGGTAHFGLEMLIPAAPEIYLTLEAGIAQRSHQLASPLFDPFTEPGGGFVNGDFVARFTEAESYRVRSQHVVTGVGIEQHINRLRVQLSGRIGYRLADRILFREETNFTSNRPMNEFEVEVTSGERFANGIQTHRIDLNKRWRFQLGTSVRYTLTKRLEVGLATYYDLGNYRVERHIVGFCNNCTFAPSVAPFIERIVKNRGIEFLLSTRFVL